MTAISWIFGAAFCLVGLLFVLVVLFAIVQFTVTSVGKIKEVFKHDRNE